MWCLITQLLQESNRELFNKTSQTFTPNISVRDCCGSSTRDFYCKKNWQRKEKEEGGGEEPIRAHSRMLIMQLQLFQLTCKLPIWTQRGRQETVRRHTLMYGETQAESAGQSVRYQTKSWKIQASHKDVVFMPFYIKTQSLSDGKDWRGRRQRESEPLHHQLYGAGRAGVDTGTQTHTRRKSDLGLAYLSSPPALAS